MTTFYLGLVGVSGLVLGVIAGYLACAIWRWTLVSETLGWIQTLAKALEAEGHGWRPGKGTWPGVNFHNNLPHLPRLQCQGCQALRQVGGAATARVSNKSVLD